MHPVADCKVWHNIFSPTMMVYLSEIHNLR
jgi:hypothetical protein